MKPEQMHIVLANNNYFLESSDKIKWELQESNFNVTVCKSVKETLPLFHPTVKKKPDLLIINADLSLGEDLSEPQMTGTEGEASMLGAVFIKYIKALNPNLPVIALVENSLSRETLASEKKTLRNFEIINCDELFLPKLIPTIWKFFWREPSTRANVKPMANRLTSPSALISR